jgi:hypothetical protein
MASTRRSQPSRHKPNTPTTRPISVSGTTERSLMASNPRPHGNLRTASNAKSGHKAGCLRVRNRHTSTIRAARSTWSVQLCYRSSSIWTGNICAQGITNDHLIWVQVVNDDVLY